MDDKPVNTGENSAEKPKKKGQFEKGDKRINRKGRPPKTFDALRKLAQRIAGEALPTPLGADGKPNPDAEVVTRIEALLRVLSTSRNSRDRLTFLEYTYGKPAQAVDITSGGKPLSWADFIAGSQQVNKEKHDDKDANTK